jgi:hypothetical protein
MATKGLMRVLLFVPNIPVLKQVTFPKFLNFGKVRATQKIKKLPNSEKLFYFYGL